MVGRFSLLALVFVVGIAVASLAPGVPQTLRKLVGLAVEPGAAQSQRKDAVQLRDDAGNGHEDKPATVKLTQEQIAEAHIDVASVDTGVLARRIIVPGAIIPDSNRIARVAVKLSGTVAELRKNLGDRVLKDEVLAVLESREVADAKSEYLAARLTQELQQELF